MEFEDDPTVDDPSTSREPAVTTAASAGPASAARPDRAADGTGGPRPEASTPDPPASPPAWSAAWSPGPAGVEPAGAEPAATTGPAPTAPPGPATPPSPPSPPWLAGGPPPAATASVPATDPAAPTGGNGRPAWRRRAAAIGVVALLAGATGAGIALAVDDGDTTVFRTTTASGDPVRSITLDGETLDVAGVVAKAGPSVVSIQTQVGGRIGGSAAGTGIVLTADGEILTNAHVVEGATRITVTLPGEVKSREAELVGSDADSDLALLKIAGVSGLTPAELGDSSELAVGDDVVAIGNALALRGGPTVTRGIVSALDRTLDAGAQTMTGLLQTDASISSGNSGGPLVNAAGQVIGINTAVATSNGNSSAENVGFAIPVNAANPIVERLRSGGSAGAKGYLGVRTSDPTDGSRGTLIVSVEADSPAAEAGLEAGDLVVSVGGRTVDGAAALAAAVRAHEPGDEVELIVFRDGEEIVLTAVLEEATDG
ncbi:MAG: S1C family serine protease [Acidimicrobiia bacterium]